MLTILTPTYNRRHTLPKLYESLCKQDQQNFEWMIVDDGSTDDTASWVHTCRHHAKFPVQIIRQENGGKHVALNTGIAAANGDWIFIVDSDDLLTANAIGCLTKALIQASAATTFVAGVCFRRADSTGCLLGRSQTVGQTPFIGTPSQVARMVQGDLAYVFRRDVMVRLPFPVIRGENFVPELYIWNKISDQGQIWFYLNHAVYLCEYLDDGYTRNFHANLRRNPRGFFLFYSAQISREPRFINKMKAVVRCVQCLGYQAVRYMRESAT